MRISFDNANVPQFAYTTEAREFSLAAIKEAYAQIGQSRQAKTIGGAGETLKQKSTATPGPFKGLQSFSLVLKSAVSLLGLMGIWAAILVWQANLGRAAPDLPTASIANATKNQPASVAPPKPNATIEAQTKPAATESQVALKDTPSDPAAVASSSELARQLQNIARDLANVEQGLDQLKAEQSRMARENSELNEQVKAMREVARRNIELTEGVKAMQEQTAREISGLGERLKASQDLMTTVAGQLRDNQAQTARMAAEQKQKNARRLAPVLAASPTGSQPQAPRNVQPRQQ